MARRAWNTRPPTRDGAEGAGTIAPEDDGGGNEGYLLRAPPKPAPAMREAVARLIRGAKISFNYSRAVWIEPDEALRLADAILTTSAPAPPADGAICGWSSNGINVHGDKVSIDAVDAAFHSHGQIDELKRNLRHWREECGKLHAKASHSPAVAAEPEPNWDKIAEEYMPSTASPPVRGDREAIARIIHGDSEDFEDLIQASMSHGPRQKYRDQVAELYRKADAILSLPVQPGAGEREKALRDEIFCLREVVRGVRILDHAGRFKEYDGEPWLRRVRNIGLDHDPVALSRQAPHSSSEG